MLDFLTLPPELFPLVIFAMRVTDISLDTLRVLFVVRGRRLNAWVLGFFQSAIWVVAVTSVLSNLDNILNILGYAAGFASGTVVGMWIEERLAIGHGNLRIISSHLVSAIAESIREAGYAATEFSGRGKEGTVGIITCSVRRKDIDRVRKQVIDIDPEAFITVGEVRPLHRGFWRS
jgi:uncharacterized protein YebE (UPF0316 family)